MTASARLRTLTADRPYLVALATLNAIFGVITAWILFPLTFGSDAEIYRRGALADTLAGGADLPGACATTAEMHSKARRLLAGDRDLAEDIRMSQGRIVDTFATDLARRQWAEVLDHEP